jgi:hypothetical protein
VFDVKLKLHVFVVRFNEPFCSRFVIILLFGRAVVESEGLISIQRSRNCVGAQREDIKKGEWDREKINVC